MTLDPVSDDETLAMAAVLLEADDLAPVLRQLVTRRAEGNPFFVEELTRYLREHDLLTADDAGATLKRELAEREVAGTVHDLLKARIDRLPQRLKRILQLSAVVALERPLTLRPALRAPERRRH